MEILSQASLISAQANRFGPGATERAAQQRAAREDQAATRTERTEDTPPPRDDPVDRVEVRNRAEDEAAIRAQRDESQREADRMETEDRRAEERSDGVGRREAPSATRTESYERPGSRLDVTV